MADTTAAPLPRGSYFTEARIRASANRLRSAARSSFPAVAGPSFSDESPHDDDHLREGQPEVDDLLPALGTPYQLLVGILPGVGALHDPSSGRLEGRWPSPLGDLRDEPALQQSLAGKIGIVATIEADARVLRHQPERRLGWGPKAASRGGLRGRSPTRAVCLSHPRERSA